MNTKDTGRVNLRKHAMRVITLPDLVTFLPLAINASDSGHV